MSLNRVVAAALALVLTAACQPPVVTPTDEHQRLLDRGIAEFENERPGDAALAFEELAAALPRESAAHANLAIARLRQQDFDGARAAVDEALRLAPDDGHVAAISAEIFHWAGQQERALGEFERAATAAPDHLEILFRLYEQASQLRGESAETAEQRALERLTELRPENLVLLLARGRQALAEGDRTAASGAFLRIGELLWGAQDPAPELLDRILAALEIADLDGAWGPAQGLENVLKITPAYQQGLRELSTAIQGVPITRLSAAPPPGDFGAPGSVRYAVARTLAGSAVAPGGLAVADFDRDGDSDVAWQATDGGLFLIETGVDGGEPIAVEADARAARLAAVDVDNDGFPDLLHLAADRSRVLLGTGSGFAATDGDYPVAAAPVRSGVAIDFDIEGDLDLVLAIEGAPGLELLRNALDGTLEPIGDRAFARSTIPATERLLSTDFDRDGDLDLIALGTTAVRALRNLRQGEFEDADVGLESVAGVVDGASADLDNDGWPDLVLLEPGEVSWAPNTGGEFGSLRPIETGLSGELEAVVPLDADADGRLDLAVAGADGVALLLHGDAGGFSSQLVSEAPPTHTLATLDFDGDGDEDLVAAGASGLFFLEGSGAEGRGWLRLRLHGLEKGSSKNNALGIGSTIEVRRGSAYQVREVDSDVTHFGLGDASSADVVRVVWTNGVPQNRIELAADRTIVEEQLLKGSCPFVYVWNGEEIEFGTDLLWGAPIGLPVAPGVWAGADPTEIVHLPAAVPKDGHYDLRITEELWEAAFFDLSRLWIVDHPESVEVASNLAILPGRVSNPEVLATRDVRSMRAAWDAAGREVTDRIRERDEIYADGWTRGRYQGQTREPWSFTFDLGAAPGGPIRLLLDGWIFPTDASLNLAIAQRSDAAPPGPRLEVETPAGWRVLLDRMPFPAGKTKTMVVDTPSLPAGASRLRIVSRQWLSWDQLRWSTNPDDDRPQIVAKLAPSSAELRYRGFSRLVRRSPNAPHAFDYGHARSESPWLPFPGRYTRYGDVRDLLSAADDRLAILAPGDELHLVFSSDGLPSPPAGWRRTVFLESHGWDKDADRNTRIAETMEPLPFRAMKSYADDPYPETIELAAYREEWLTRRVE